MPDQAVIDGSIKQGPALSATSDLPNLIPAATPEPAPTVPPVEPAVGPASGVPDAAGQSPDGTGAPSGEQPQLPLEEAPQSKPDRLQPRLSELARQRQEAMERENRANARTDRILEANLALQEQLKELITRYAPPAPPSDQPPVNIVRPRPSEFTDPDAYDDAIADWAEQRAVARAEIRAQEIAREAEQARAAAERQRQQQTEQQAAEARENELVMRWNANVSAYAKDHPDFDIQELSDRRGEDFPMTKPVLGALLMTEAGPAVLNHLGAHPEELKRIAVLPEALIPLEIAKIEGRLSVAPPPPPPAPRAPAPPTNRVGNNAAAAQETMVDIGSQPGRTEEYAKMRMPQLQAERKAQMFGVRQP